MRPFRTPVQPRPGPEREPFTAVEELSCYFDSADEPNVVLQEAHVGGHLDPPLLHAAVLDTLAACARARRRRAPGSRWARRLLWETPAELDVTPVAVAAWRDPDELAELRERFLATAVPVGLSPPMRVLLAVGPAHDVVMLGAHHAICDGVSGLWLMRTVSRAYRTRSLASRDSAVSAGAVPALAGPAIAEPRAGAPRARRAFRPPGGVTRVAADGGTRRAGYGVRHATLPVPRPPRSGTGPRATVNDLLIAALSLAIDRWNAAHGVRRGRIRITVPVNTRPPERRWEGMGNESRLIAVTTWPRERADPRRLPALVAARTRARKLEPGPQVDAASRAFAAAWYPVAVKDLVVRAARRLAGPLLTDSSLVTNLGALPDPPCFGGTPGPVWAATPAPMPRGVSVGAVTVAGRLHVCVQYRHALFGRTAADGFTATFLTAIAQLADAPDGARSAAVPAARRTPSPADPASELKGAVMLLDERLLRILACPIDKEALLHFPDEGLLYNPRLRRTYRLDTGIPVLLADRAETASDELHRELVERAVLGEVHATLGRAVSDLVAGLLPNGDAPCPDGADAFDPSGHGAGAAADQAD